MKQMSKMCHFQIKPLLLLNWLLLTYAKPVKVPFHYETQSHQQTYNRPGNSGGTYTSITQFQSQNRPTAGNYFEDSGPNTFGDSRVNSYIKDSGSTYLSNSYGRKIYTSKFTNSNFNRLPARPEFDDYEDIDDGDNNGIDSGEQLTNQGSPNAQQYYPGGGSGYLGTFHKLKRKKKRGVICVPQGHGYGGLFSGLFGGPFGGFGGLGSGLGFGGLGFGSLFRNNEDGQDIESRQSSVHEDPRFLIKAPQFNFYGYPTIYKPANGYPCRPVDFYGQRPGFGQFGYFGDPVSGGGNRPGVQSDTPVRPGGGALGILSDAVKPVLESTAIQDGIGSTVSYFLFKFDNKINLIFPKDIKLESRTRHR